MNQWDNFVRGVHLALLLLCCLLIAVLCWGAWHVYRATVALETDARRTIVIAGGAAADIEQTLRIERQAAAAQIAQAQAAERAVADSANSVDQSAKSLDALLARTDTSLNSPNGLLPRLASIPPKIADTLAAAQASLADLDAAEKQLEPAIQNFNRAATSAANVAGDPNIPLALAHVEQSTASLAGASAQIEGSAADVHAFIHRETTPARGTWHVVKSFLSSFAGPAAQVATAAK